MIPYILSYLSNTMALLIIMFFYLLFFVKGFTLNIRKLFSIIAVFLIINALTSISGDDIFVIISVLGILPVIDILCCRNRIYNLFMIIPSYLFYALMSVFPAYIIRLITRTEATPLYGVESLTVSALITDFCLVMFLMGTYIICRRRKIDLRLKPLEILGFFAFFIFILFMIYSMGVYNATQRFVPSIILDLSAVFFILVIFLAYWSYLIIVRDRKNIKMDAENAKNYISMQLDSLELEEANRQEIKIIKHDLRNHLQVIQEMCNTRQYSQMEAYISGLSGNPELSKSFHITGNQAADTVISLKKASADSSGIRFICDGSFQWLDNMIPMDVCTVFSNLLDNALEGVKTAKDSYISIKGTDHENFYTLTFSNSVPEDVKIRNNSVKTSKKDKKQHGIGLSSVDSAIRKYNGQYTLKCKDLEFSVQVVFSK